MNDRFAVVDRPRGFQQQEPRLLDALRQAPLAICKFWRDGSLVNFLEGGDRLGAGATSRLAKHYRDAFKDAPEIVSCIERSFQGEMVAELLSLEDAQWDGRFFPMSEKGTVAGVVAILSDATARLSAFRSFRTLDILSSVSRCLAQSDGEGAFLADVCAMIENNGYAAWIGMVDRADDSRTVRVVASGPELPAFLQMPLTWDPTAKSGQHLVGDAIRTGKVQVANDMAHAKECAPWRTEAQRIGWRSALAVPLVLEGASLGVLTLFARATFDAQEPPLWEQIAADIVDGIKAFRERAAAKKETAARHEANENYRRLVEAAFDIIIVVDRQLKIVDINTAGMKLAGALSRGDLIGSHLAALTDSRERGKLREMFQPSSAEVPDKVPVVFRLLGIDGRSTDVEGVTVPCLHEGQPAQLCVLRDVTQRNREAKALSDAKASLDHAQRIAKMASVDIDLSTGHVQWSANAANVLGAQVPGEASAFLDAFSSIDDAERRALSSLLDHIRRSGVASSIEVALRRSAGIKTIHVHGIPLSDSRGDIDRVFVVLQDVTELRAIESGLKRTAERLRAAQEVGRTGDFEVKGSHEILLTQSAAKLMGVGNGDCVLSIDALARRFADSDAEVVANGLNSVIASQVESCTADGRLTALNRWLNIEASRVVAEGGTRIIGNIRDITDRKKAELATRNSEARLKRAQQIARAWEFRWDVVRDEITWSDAIGAVLGSEPSMQTLKFDHLMSTLRAEDREAFRVAAHNTLKNGVPGEIEYFQYLYNNERFQVVSRWEVSARDETGKVVEISGITQDITSLRAAQERVAYRQRFHGPTGLPNQNIAFDRLAYLLGQARAGSLRLSVVGIRIKNYKALRDSVPAEAFYGALKAAVRSTQDMSRDIDLVARLENGTFVVFSREEKLPTGGAVAQAVQDRWARAVASLGSGVAAEVRTTVVTVPDEGTDAEAVVKLMAFRLTQL